MHSGATAVKEGASEATPGPECSVPKGAPSSHALPVPRAMSSQSKLHGMTALPELMPWVARAAGQRSAACPLPGSCLT